MEFTNRPGDVDKTSQILLTFSDGETQTVDLERDVTIAELVETNSVNSVRIEVTGVYGSMNNGAMEITFYGIPSPSEAGNNNLFQIIFLKLLQIHDQMPGIGDPIKSDIFKGGGNPPQWRQCFTTEMRNSKGHSGCSFHPIL